MTPRVIPIALAVLAALVAAPAAQAASATLRVISPQGTALGAYAPQVGSARSFVDTGGTAHVLPAHTALGQVVALSAFRDLPLRIDWFTSGGFSGASPVQFGAISTGPTTYWAFFVNGRYQSVGSDLRTVEAGDQTVFVLDDWQVAGEANWLELDRIPEAAGSVRFRAHRVLEPAPGTWRPPVVAPAVWVRFNGRLKRTAADGTVSFRLAKGERFRAIALRRGLLRSEILRGRA